jgi:hypothetical protein
MEIPEETQRMRRGFILTALLGGALGVSACSSTQLTEGWLAKAGFRQMPADTPAKLAHLQTLPEHQLVARDYKGQRYYVYADASGCRCLYIGGSQQYQTFQQLMVEKSQENKAALEEATNWEIQSLDFQP